jgi:iron complex outermembrane receptor protein
VTAEGYAEQVRHVTVPGDPADFTLDLRFHEDPVIVTTSAEPRDPMQVYHPADVLGGEQLEWRATSSIGTTLQNEPGITTTSLSQASSRPVIRGLGGNRVLVLEDGSRTGDVSFLSDDHAVAVNPLQARSIEVIRGAANLLYGSNAIGGVVNVMSGDVPAKLNDEPTGSVAFGGSSNTGELTGGLDLEGAFGAMGYHLGGWRSDAGEYEFNGGTAGNSQSDFTTFNGGLSYIGNAGYAGFAYRDQDADYGIPVSEDGELIEEGGHGITIRMQEESLKLRGELTHDFGIFSGGRFQAIRHDYTHTEFEDTGEEGTVFDQETSEYRADLTHRDAGRFSGTFGGSYLDSELQAQGEEAYLPYAKTTGYAAFFYEEVDLGGVRLQFGGRYDQQDVDPGSGGEKRDFSGGSGAVGAIIHPKGTWSIPLNVTSNFKVPSAEELFADGPHLANLTFEIGDPTLTEETSLGIDVGLRWETPRFSGEVSVFRTDFSDFIFLDIDPNVLDGDPNNTEGLPTGTYLQTDALFYGAEAHADISLVEHLTLDVTADMVIADDDETGEPLPRIPPLRAGLGVHWDTDRYGVGGEARFSDEQDRVAPNETPTNAFTIYNLFGHVQFSGGSVVHRVSLRVTNLTDRLYRNHISRVKEVLPEPGRAARLLYTLVF